jgi:protein-S-isoprenylcysteine O-methyltransferase Ste14
METVYTPIIFLLNTILNLPSHLPYIKLRHIINAQKAGTGLFTIYLMGYFNNYNLGSWLYLALHGTYGILWLLKDMTYPDPNFNRTASPFAHAAVGIVLVMYWYLPYIMVSGEGIQNPTGVRVVVCVFLLAIGSALMLVSDAQKYYTLKFKQGLISDGMFAYTRNPNYLGEIMIYLSFAICTGHLLAYSILVSIWLILFVTLMLNKERSLRKKKGWEEYSRRSWMLLPKIWESDLGSIVFYSVLSYIIYYLHYNLQSPVAKAYF